MLKAVNCVKLLITKGTNVHTKEERNESRSSYLCMQLR